MVLASVISAGPIPRAWIKWSEYCSLATELEIGYLPSAEENGGGAKVYAFGTRDAFNSGIVVPGSLCVGGT
jgi:hypothetical protein